MLQLKNIVKTYLSGENSLTALRGVDVSFRHNEFVSILGQSGCGKTTLLNIIGGLDQCTDGDLIINGKSTRRFKARDWDTYRNHTIGFVFQSYNLIPHQSVLQNVELALTLSGVKKAERRRCAKAALEQVGLSSQMRKKPSEMSGGQMQRVAIARALVNNPDIILADEPTGALDTETSVQVMDILKEVAKDRLVIMVTHNPELAQKYSTRIIRMLDGQITGDTNPLTQEDVEVEQALEAETRKTKDKQKKPSMSLFTAFGLSLKNLFTKKGRTALTSFAGSIGIIGIALILAMSTGMTTYINTVQEDTLASYPLMLESTHIDISSLMQNFIGAAISHEEHDKDAVYQKAVLYDLINSLNSIEESENDLASFKKYLEEKRADPNDPSGLHDVISGVQYSYDLDFLVYTKNVDGEIIKSDSTALMQELIAKYMGAQMAQMTEVSTENNPMGSMMNSPMSSGVWQEMLTGDNGKLINPLLEKQYDVIYGSWPNSYNEIVLVVDENNEIDDTTLYALGLKSQEEIDAIMQAAVSKTELPTDTKSWTYEEICGMEFRTILNADCYAIDERTGLYTDLRETEAGMKYVFEKGIPLKVSGIIRPNEDAVSAMLTGSIGYTGALTQHVIQNAKGAAPIKAQLDSPSTDIFTGLPFKAATESMTVEEKQAAFKDYIGEQDAAGKASTYVAIMCIPTEQQKQAAVAQAMNGLTRADMETQMTQMLTQQMGMGAKEIADYLADLSDEDMTAMYRKAVEEQVKAQYAATVKQQLSAMSTPQLAAAMDAAIKNYTAQQCADYYDEVLTFSDATYEDNLAKLGYLDLDNPSAINLYAATFAGKDVIEDAIAEYNDTVDELSEIVYTDYVGIMMSSVTTIINAITYVLIAFVAISLIVSSIMIGVITLISVQERTKEIGILRAIGASKHNVSSMFNAETVIIGFTSGLLGVLVTYLLCIPINALVHHLTGIENLNAVLPPAAAVILVLISVVLTLFSGIIPSRSAAKKDPVVALRTE